MQQETYQSPFGNNSSEQLGLQSFYAMNAKNVIRILIVDDDEDDFFITSDYIRHIPGSTFEIDWCHRYEDALKRVCEKQHDLYFVDYRLGARTGVELLRDALEQGCEQPIILLTGKGNQAVDIEAMQLGAVDYLIKTELNTEKLERSIRYALERAASLRALRANERKYRSIFEKSKDMVFITDDMYDFKDVNDAWKETFGYSREELMQMNICDLIDQPGHKKYFTHALQTNKELIDWEVTLTAKNGEKRVGVLSATHEDRYSNFPYVQGIIHDITNLRRVEKEKLQGEKMAAAGRLVRTLAHEVRNPLNNITLSVEQMMQESLGETAELYLNIIQRNSKRISDLISELLNTSRPSEITLEHSTLQTILDDVIGAAIDRLTLKRIKLKVSYPDVPVNILADVEKLKLAILNIVINAIEAMSEGDGELSITVQTTGDVAKLVVADNGSGIAEENISKLFEPYFTQKRNGMGLGLAFTLNILQGHKSTIDVQSALGKGTVFTVTFPVASADDISSVGSEQEEMKLTISPE